MKERTTPEFEGLTGRRFEFHRFFIFNKTGWNDEAFAEAAGHVGACLPIAQSGKVVASQSLPER